MSLLGMSLMKWGIVQHRVGLIVLMAEMISVEGWRNNQIESHLAELTRAIELLFMSQSHNYT